MFYIRGTDNFSIKQSLAFLGLFLFITSCKSEDQSDFVDNYQPFSISTIQLKVRETSRDTISSFATSWTNIPVDQSKSALLLITDKGTYYLKLQVDRPMESTLTFNNSIYNIIVLPNDTTFVELSAGKDGIGLQFTGKLKPLNDYLSERRKFRNNQRLDEILYELKKSSKTYNDLVLKTDSIISKEIEFVDQSSKAQTLPEWFVQYERAELEYGAARFRLLAGNNKEISGDSVPPRYYGFLELVKINNESAVLSSKYFSFLDELFITKIDHTDFDGHAGFPRVSIVYDLVYKQAEKELSGKALRIYSQYIFGVTTQFTSDSLVINSLARKYKIDNLYLYRSLYRGKDGNKYLQKNDKVPEFFALSTSDQQVSIRDFSDKKIYLNFWATWCGPCLENIPALNKFIDEYSSTGDIVFLNICMDSEKGDWRNLLVKSNLKGINLFLDDKGSEELTSIFNLKGVPNYVLLDTVNRLSENHTDKTPGIKIKIDELLLKDLNARKKP